MSIKEIASYLRTLRYLRASQWGWRAYYILERNLRSDTWGPSPGIKSAEVAIAEAREFPSVPLFRPTAPADTNETAMMERGEFHHLNQTMILGRDRPDWKLGNQTLNRLWINNLHSHYWAYDLAKEVIAGEEQSNRASELFLHYLSDWMERCELEVPGAKHLAWNSFVVATRLSWWIRSWLEFKAAAISFPPEFETRLLHSMRRQASYLERHIEWDLRGNHLFRDAVGLAWAGRFFCDEQAEQWMRTATKIAVSQAKEQVLEDGGHFERSPMYHIQIMEDVLSLALLLTDKAAAEKMRATWERMAEFLAWMRHPDGAIPLFNDAALHASCEPNLMLSFGKQLGVYAKPELRRGGRLFAQTGIAVWHDDRWSMFFDVGAGGPDYQPGHTHADTLAFEGSFRGRRLFVDAGVYSYDNNDERKYDRSTRSHNTVCVDGQDSSEVWHIFRVGRRAQPLEVSATFTAGHMRALASHNGYDHLPGRPRHGRAITISGEGLFSITDTVEGRGEHEVSGGLLIEPGWKASPAPGGWELCADSDRVRVRMDGPGPMKLFEEKRKYHPEFGRELDSARLSWSVKGPLPLQVQTIISQA